MIKVDCTETHCGVLLWSRWIVQRCPFFSRGVLSALLWLDWNRTLAAAEFEEFRNSCGEYLVLLWYYTDLVSMTSFCYHNYMVLDVIFGYIFGWGVSSKCVWYCKQIFCIASFYYYWQLRIWYHWWSIWSKKKVSNVCKQTDFRLLSWVKFLTTIHVLSHAWGGRERALRNKSAAVLKIVSNHGNWTLEECEAADFVSFWSIHPGERRAKQPQNGASRSSSHLTQPVFTVYTVLVFSCSDPLKTQLHLLARVDRIGWYSAPLTVNPKSNLETVNKADEMN